MDNNQKKKKRNRKGSDTVFLDSKTNKYRGQTTVGYDSNGKRIRLSVTAKTQKEVLQLLEQMKSDWRKGQLLEKSEITFYELAHQIIYDDFLTNRVKDSTYRRNLETLKSLKPIAELKLQKITEQDIRDYNSTLTSYSQSTINKRWQMMQRTFNEAIEREIIAKNPMHRLNKAKSAQSNQKVRALTLAEQKKLVSILQKETETNHRAQILISMSTGMRMGEVNALNIEDVNFREKSIKISKTIAYGKAGEIVVHESPKTDCGKRTIGISNETLAILKKSIDGRKKGKIFLKNDKLISTASVNAQLDRIFEKYNILDNSVPGKVSCHSLRHTYATRALESGMNHKVLQHILGHSDVQITLNTYCDVFIEYKTGEVKTTNDYLRENGLLLCK